MCAVPTLLCLGSNVRCAYGLQHGSSVRGWGLTSRERGPAAGKRGRMALMLPTPVRWGLYVADAPHVTGMLVFAPIQ